jgi:peptide/nickel transport system permease protein
MPRILRSFVLTLIAPMAVGILLASFFLPHPPSTQFVDRAYAPPMNVRMWHDGAPRAPFVYAQVLEDRLYRRYSEDQTRPIPLVWFAGGALVSTGDASQPVLLFGADALGRDVFSRLLYGARLSLGVVALGVLGALVIGMFVGGLAGTAGGRLESALMWGADWLLALPGAYLVLVLRGALPLVITPAQTFTLMAALFAFAAWPHVARGVRAIVAAERVRDYAEASRASGAGLFRLTRNLLPAARGFLLVEVLLLVPALLVAEATVSFLGLGFADSSASWGTMLQDAANVRIIGEAPWMLAPVAGIFVVALLAQLLGAAGRVASVDLVITRPSPPVAR